MLRIFLFLVLAAECLFPQTIDSAVVFKEGDLAGLTVEDSRFYDGSALWGYMNGGADLFLEYDFQLLAVQEISIDSRQFSVEIFQMDSPASAFGIYSVSSYRGEPVDCFEFSRLYKPQVQFAYGNYYAAIVALSKENVNAELLQKLGCQLKKKIDAAGNEQLFEIPSYFSESTKLESFLPELKYVTGRLGLENSFSQPEASPLGSGDFTAYILDAEFPEGNVIYYLITFARAESLQAYLTKYPRISETDESGMSKGESGFRYFSEESDTTVLLIESDILNREDFKAVISLE